MLPDGKKVPLYDETDCPLIGYMDDTRTEDKDRYEAAWRNYLYCMNMMQFAPKQVFVTRKGIEGDLYAWYAKRHRTQAANSVRTDPRWDGIIEQELYDPACVELAKTLRDQGRKAPDEVGMESEDGSVVAEMAWKEDKIAVQLECQKEFRDQLAAEGWKVFDVTENQVAEFIKEV